MPAMQENHDDHHDKSNHEDDRLDVGITMPFTVNCMASAPGMPVADRTIQDAKAVFLGLEFLCCAAW